VKIAFVTNTCWNVYNFRKGLAHHFINSGHEVIALAPRDQYTVEIEKWGIRFIETPFDGTGVNPLKDVSYLNLLIRIFKQEKPTVSLSYTIKSNIYSSIAGRIAKVPTICNVSGLGTVFLVKGVVGKLAILLYKSAFKFSDFIFFQNEDDKKLFTSIITVNPAKIGMLPGSGINLNEFKYSAPNIEIPTKFLMISRLIIEKGVREFAEAASHFKDDDNVSFTLIGNLDLSHSRTFQKEEVQKWVENKWINYKEHSNNVAEVIIQHEVIVLPSYREGTPRTLLEGAAIGRALLASDVPGCREVVVEGSNGFLFEARSSQSIVDRVKLYLSLSKEERLQLSSNSRRLVEQRFDENYVIQQYVDVIHRISKQA
jgi:glycosyltransferase involved in cell wall biosynthesis